jgi:hypothetical protein
LEAVAAYTDDQDQDVPEEVGLLMWVLSAYLKVNYHSNWQGSWPCRRWRSSPSSWFWPSGGFSCIFQSTISSYRSIYWINLNAPSTHQFGKAIDPAEDGEDRPLPGSDLVEALVAYFKEQYRSCMK